MTKVVTPEKVQATINLWKRHLLCFWIQEEGTKPRVIHEWGSSGVGYDCFIDWAQKLQAGASLRGTPQRDSVRDNQHAPNQPASHPRARDIHRSSQDRCSCRTRQTSRTRSEAVLAERFAGQQSQLKTDRFLIAITYLVIG